MIGQTVAYIYIHIYLYIYTYAYAYIYIHNVETYMHAKIHTYIVYV